MGKTAPENAEKPRFEAVGWKFWLVLYFGILGPCIYYSKSLSYSEVTMLGWSMQGAFIAGIITTVITWVANVILQWSLEARRKAAPKKSKKSKKKGR